MNAKKGPKSCQLDVTAAHPVAIQTRDGKIHVVYTSQNRQVVNRVIFDETAIVGKAE